VKRWLLWLLLTVVLAAAGYVAVAVPVGGRTLLQRVCGEPGAAPGTAAGASSGKAGDPRGSDRLTDEDRRELDRLIESKLKKEAGGEDRPPGPP